MSEETEEPEERFNVTAEALREYDWASVIDSCERKECFHYYERLSAESAKLDTRGDKLGGRVFALLSVVASFHANYDASGNPYGSMWSGFNGRRSLNAEDLTERDLAALAGVVDEITDPELRARVADVLWVTKRNFKTAKSAIVAFLESAERLKTNDMWPPYSDRLTRAAQIAAKKGFESEKADVLQAIEASITEHATDLKSGLLCDRLMGIMVVLKAGNMPEYAGLSEKLARQFSEQGNWHFAEVYWERAELWHRRAKNEAEVLRCRIARGECYVSRAEAGPVGRGTNYMYSAHWMGRAVEMLRSAKAASERVAAVNKRFLELQKLSLGEMGRVEVPVDELPGFREEEQKARKAAAERVRGVDFPTAIARFALINRPTSVEGMKEQYAKTAESAPLMHIIGASAIDRSGMTTDRIPARLPREDDQNDEAARKQMVQQAQIVNWPLRVAWQINPAREAIRGEHGVRLRDLWFLVENNPFIPAGHEGIVLRGIQAGFCGDWLTAMHLLVPQVEASIRHVLQQRGVVTSTMDGEGLQKELDLNQLLWMKEVEEVFGLDVLFDLRGILIERFGHNLRNELAHGLLPEGGCYHPATEYLWWLLLHIYWRGFHFVQTYEVDHLGNHLPPEKKS
ncbi:DUF4209 domain-containing protein [Actomonas aquatica]|uniref:DUF4209 domain-containing protein n=1 Tax=Actomonas aquatica TaxID=2866162 RepID=A0ABZ1C466_9BACT|nr:DUF4209 domain-containing protein [Opitutus sp. WL0086]WRQ86152.1 DUF4209 domain-containing protein [Opitutus sp. WL0086]